jgi:hypothetical protein
MDSLKKLLEDLVSDSSNELSENVSEVETDNVALSGTEKKDLYESINRYNEYRSALKATSIHECIGVISNAIQLAERYAISESSDWMEAKMIKDDVKEMKKLSDGLCRESSTIKDIEAQMEMLYEQLGMKLERYFKIK